MHSLNIIILIILAACLLPYIFAFIARLRSGYKRHLHGSPREYLATQTGLVARANAVQQNSFEGLPLFIAAMLMADYLVVPDYFSIMLGSVYILLRILYGISYLCNAHLIRSILWVLATLCPIILLWMCIRF
ncbi:MAPEG family protein [Acinetobacter qingfengensis]|uniref:Uncharacterized protein n=1 Tax=Acinetobacter qingfengensis TaxID=1262585 RepID=A0A1E7RD71_9GAMM|nr:MAPEG family protein [Acinetobacter qingfengensis]KAA8732147.1 MAPEG family protein [Acinetobacter qingfengensis]OEY97226.1 hypothetical protein BJI46_02025 [Acinetobacter qingfengensis]